MPCCHVSDKLPTIRYGYKFLHQQAVQLVNICSATLPKGIFGVGLTAPNRHYNSVHIYIYVAVFIKVEIWHFTLTPETGQNEESSLRRMHAYLSLHNSFVGLNFPLL
jgi:hypothetical protein